MKKHYITFAALAMFLSVSGHSLYANNSVGSLESDASISVYGSHSASDAIRIVYEHLSHSEARIVVRSVLLEMDVPIFNYSDDTLLSEMGLDSLDIFELSDKIEGEVYGIGYEFDAYYFEIAISCGNTTLRDLIIETSNASTRAVEIYDK